MMRRRTVLCLAFVLAIACGSDSSTGPSGGSVSGTWNLRSVNGTNLPYSFPPDQGVTTSVLGSVLTMSGSVSGAYNEVISYRAVGPSGTVSGTLNEVGTWSSTGGSITFNDQTDGVVYQGSVSGSTLTEITNGFTQVYTR